MKKYRINFEIDEEVEAEDREDAVNEAISKVCGCWFDNELTQYIRRNAYVEILEDEEDE